MWRLYYNSNAIELLEKNQEIFEIDYESLAYNRNGIHIFEDGYNNNKINCLNDNQDDNDEPYSWITKHRTLRGLLYNPSAIGFLERNQKFLKPEILSNSGIFEINYDYC